MIDECVRILQQQTNQTIKNDQYIIADFLQHIPYFKGICSKEELQDRLQELAKYVEYEEINENNAVFHKGEQSNISVFIPKPPQDIDLEMRWKQNLEILNSDLKNINPSHTKAQQNRQQIQSQISQGMSILRCLRNQEDEELLKINYFSKYFKSNGQICSYKKIKVLGQYENFGESILSQQNSQRTATLISHNGVYIQEQQNNEQTEIDQIICGEQENQVQQNPEDNNINNTIKNNKKLKKVIMLGKISKKNYLKVFQQELEKRTFIRKALLNNFKNDLEEGVLDNLAFFFKEEHLEKNTVVVREFQNHSKNTSPNNKNNGFISERKDYSQLLERKRAQEITVNPIYPSPNNEEEHLYLLYKGSIEVRKNMKSTYSKCQVKNIDSSLQQNVVSRASKVNLRLAQLSEGEFFGHENWFKEEFERIISNFGDISPTNIFQDKLIQLQKDYSIIALETDTVIYKIPRKILCEIQNRKLLKSLIIHGKQRNARYLQLTQECIEKTEENILKQIQSQNLYFINEKENKIINNNQKITSLIAENILQKKLKKCQTSTKLETLENLDINNECSSDNDSDNNDDNQQIDDSPIFKKTLIKEFNSFKMKLDSAFTKNLSRQNTKICQEIKAVTNLNEQRQKEKNQQSVIRSPSKRNIDDNNTSNNTQIYSSHNFTITKEDSHIPSLYNLDYDNQESQNYISVFNQKKNVFLKKLNQRQQSLHNINSQNDKEDFIFQTNPLLSNTINKLGLTYNQKYIKENNNQVQFDINQCKNQIEINEKNEFVELNQDNFHHSNQKIIPFFTEPFNQTRDKLTRRYFKNVPLPKYNSTNVSPNRNKDNDSPVEIIPNDSNLKNRKLRIKLNVQKNCLTSNDLSPVLIQGINSNQGKQIQKIKSLSYYQNSTNGFQKNINEDNYNYQQTLQDESQSPTLIKSISLSPRKIILHKKQSSLINLNKVQETQESNHDNQGGNILSPQNYTNNNHDNEQYNQTFSQYYNQIDKQGSQQNISFDNKLSSSPTEKRVKFKIEVEKSQPNQNNLQNRIKGILSMKNFQKKIPFLKNQFIQQINQKKNLFKNEITQQQISSIQELNLIQTIPHQFIKQKQQSCHEYTPISIQKQQSQQKYSSGFYSSRNIESECNIINNFSNTSQQINNFNIQQQNSQQSQQLIQSNSLQNSPKHRFLQKQKAHSIHSNSIQNNNNNFSSTINGFNMTQNSLKQQLILKLTKLNNCHSQYTSSTQTDHMYPQTERDQLSPLNQKQGNFYPNIKVFSDQLQRDSERISGGSETKIQSAQDLDSNMQSVDTCANSQEYITNIPIPHKPIHSLFSQFKLNQQIDIPKKTVSKQIIQNCFKKK